MYMYFRVRGDAAPRDKALSPPSAWEWRKGEIREGAVENQQLNVNNCLIKWLTGQLFCKRGRYLLRTLIWPEALGERVFK